VTDKDFEQRHKSRMKRQKEVVDAAIANATEERGVIIVNTGNGKGKSSAGFGMLARALGHDMKVGVVQFIKGSFSTGEEAFFKRFENVEYHVMGDGYTWDTQNSERDKETARAAWNQALKFLSDQSIEMVLLDELNIVLKQKLLPIEEVLQAFMHRPEMQHVVVTGRAAPKELIEMADTVTEMKLIKHAFNDGVMAQKGVEL